MVTQTSGVEKTVIQTSSLIWRMYVQAFCKQYITLYRKMLSLHLQVDTEICEQTFSWMSRYARITQHMNRTHFLFYLLYLCDSHNRLN